MLVERLLIVMFILRVLHSKNQAVARLSGNILRSVAGAYSLSRQKTLDKGRDEISNILLHLNVGSGESLINRAHNLYKIAVEKNFTKGRKTSHVAAACLYIACRQTEKAYLLIDFSDYLKINVYVLGAVFLQLCKMLRLSDHPIVQKLIDPSLFIHRFTERLLGRRHNPVSEIALRIVASMKRDWMQTGRKPSGLCGAALYISALSHGFNYSKSDVVTVVHICEATLTKRLIEFENTESGSLTIEDFIARADELNDVSQSYQSPTPGQVLCEHKDTNEPHFAHGLCRQCFNEFIKISGGLKGGAEPPAFQNAEKQRMEKARAEAKTDSSSKPTADSTGCATSASQGPNLNGHHFADCFAYNDSEQDLHEEGTGDPESFSDIDDVEVDGYLHNEEEKKYKKIIWEEMNREYLEEQAAKEAAAAAAEAAEKAYVATMCNNSEEFRSAQELAAATAAALENSKKEKKRKRAEEKKNSMPAKSPLEATCQLLKRKSFSSKINYKALESLYTDGAKQQQTEIGDGEADNGEVKGLDEDAAADGRDGFGTQENVEEDRHDYDYDYGDGDDGYGDVNDNYYHNEDDNYGYGDDDYGYD
ncbi:transcription factor IIIB 90 kDa subunit isoform X2 [Phalaenopsis equestris]|uniref:transcription factor IIIB 90 kDa subunit isoform X2 n=1 Tax=Phalaenopsis equestris TaxID=78828 RepID=UPI0009E294BE|nr:transcription factor IIIB 90 kDa subunit isoform X2 [Phalaenopsis equestris]